MAKEEFLKPFRIAEIIKSEILYLSPHDVIPTERQMAERFGVSRVTIQKALEILEANAIIYRRRVAGSFVSPPRNSRQLQLRSFSEEMALRGVQISTKVLNVDSSRASQGTIEPWATISKPAYRIERLRSVSSTPLALETTYISYRVAPGIENLDLTGSLYKLLEDDFSIEIASADERVSPVLSDKKTSKLLRIEVGTPVLEVIRTGFSDHGDLIESTKSIRRGDKFDLQFTVRR